MQENTNINLNNLNSNVNVVSLNPVSESVVDKRTTYLKIFIFIFLFILILGILFYFLLYKKAPTAPIAQNNTGSSFPDLNLGSNIDAKTYSDNTNSFSKENEQESDAESVSHIWPRSIAGYEIIRLRSGTSTDSFVLFMDKLSGNIYKTVYPSLENTRLTNTTLQDIDTATFSKNADFAAVLVGNGPYYGLEASRLGSETDQSFSPSEIDKNIFNVYSSKMENVFYYLKIGKNNKSSLFSFSPNSGKVSEVATFNFSDVLISGEDGQSVYVSSKPGSGIKQLTVVVNKKNGRLSYIKSGDNNKYNVTGSIIKEESGKITVSDLNNYKNNNDVFLDSFADKCSLIKNAYLVCGEDGVTLSENRVLDFWNKGVISFNDSLSFLKLSDGEKTFVPVSLISGESLDVYGLNSADNFLTFQNKNDNSLWLVDLVGL